MCTVLQTCHADLLALEAEHGARLHAAIRRYARRGWTLTFQLGDRATLVRERVDPPEWLFLRLDARGHLTERLWCDPRTAKRAPWSWFERRWSEDAATLPTIAEFTLVTITLFLSAMLLAYLITRALVAGEV